MSTAIRFSVISIIASGFILWLATSKSFEPLLILTAVFLHECGHIAASIMCQNQFNKLSLQSGGLLLSGNFAYSSYSSEAIIAFAGPFFNLVSALAFFSAKCGLPLFFRQASSALALLNLLPIQDFDGGRILRSLLSYLLPFEYVEKLCGIFSFLALFFIWSISVYVILKTGKNISSLVFSAMIFFGILKKADRKRICEIIKE